MELGRGDEVDAGHAVLVSFSINHQVLQELKEWLLAGGEIEVTLKELFEKALKDRECQKILY
jgi:hypothetical protein